MPWSSPFHVPFISAFHLGRETFNKTPGSTQFEHTTKHGVLFFSFEDSVLTKKHHDSTFDYNGTMERLAPKMEFGTDESVFMDESNGKKTKR